MLSGRAVVNACRALCSMQACALWVVNAARCGVRLPCPLHRRARGVAQLRACVRLGGVRAPLAALTLLLLHVFVPFFLSGQAREHCGEARELLAHVLRAYPDSLFFLWVAGRLAKLEGRTSDAASLFRRCAVAMGHAVPQVTHLASYELSLIEMARATPASLAACESRLQALGRVNIWTRAFYKYSRGITLLALGRADEARRCLRDVERLLERRVAGKLISAENFASKRAKEALSSEASLRGICGGAGAAASGVGTVFSGGLWADEEDGSAGRAAGSGDARGLVDSMWSSLAGAVGGGVAEEEAEEPGDERDAGEGGVAGGAGDETEGDGAEATGAYMAQLLGPYTTEEEEEEAEEDEAAEAVEATGEAASGAGSDARSGCSRLSVAIPRPPVAGPAYDGSGEGGAGDPLPPASWALPALEVAVLFNAASQSSKVTLRRWLAVSDAALLALLPPGIRVAETGLPHPLASESGGRSAEPAESAAAPPAAPFGVVLTAAACGCGIPEAAALPAERFAEAAAACGTRADDVGLCALLRGVTLVSLGRSHEADISLAWVTAHADVFQRDPHIVAFALLERASLRLSPDLAAAALAEASRGSAGKGREAAGEERGTVERWHGAVTAAQPLVEAAWAFRRDFNFKPRLHVRLHLLKDWARAVTARIDAALARA